MTSPEQFSSQDQDYQATPKSSQEEKSPKGQDTTPKPEEQTTKINQEIARLTGFTELLSGESATESDLETIKRELGISSEENASSLNKEQMLTKIQDKIEELKKQLEDLLPEKKVISQATTPSKEKQDEKKEESKEDEFKIKERFAEMVDNRPLKPNDLLISDSQIEEAVKILEADDILCDAWERIRRKEFSVNGEKSWAPGQFGLTIFDPTDPDLPASPEIMKAVFQLLNESGISVLYGGGIPE